MIFAALLLALAPHGEDPAPIAWKGKRLQLEALPAELPESARAALTAWHPWCDAHAYRLDLDTSGRILLLSRSSNDRVGQHLEFVDGVRARFERELPPPPARLDASASEVAQAPPKDPEKKGPEPLPEDPEDPEGGAHPWKLKPSAPSERSSAAPVVTTWGAQGVPPDSQTVVLLIVRDQDDFVVLLRHLASEYPYLASWEKEAKANQGFVLGEPCVAAYLELPEGVEEWNPDNELVHRLARLLVLSRFGELPNWFLLGYAWTQEIALLKGVYCFPWRDEFVWASEHGGWPAAVKARYAKERPKPADFMTFRRGKYVDELAKASYGMAAYLVAKEREKLPALLEELRVFGLQHGRIQEGPNSWRKDTEYEIPLAEQSSLFEKHLGAPWLQRAALFVRKELGQ